MKRLLLLSTVTLLLVILIGGSAFATIGRIRSLGNQDYFFKDIYHIYMNPAYLGMYTNTVYGELGYYSNYDATEQLTPDQQFLGINYKLYKGLSLGLTLNRPGGTDFSDFNSSYFPSPINQFDILASYDFSNLRLGLSLFHEAGYYEASQTDDVTDKYKETSSATALTGGFVYTLGGKHEIEGMIKLNFDRGEYTESGTGEGAYTGGLKTDGGNGIQVGARGFFQLTDNFQVIPLIAYWNESISLIGTGALESYSTTGKYKENLFIVGLGGNLKLDKGMVAGGLSLHRMKLG